MRYLSAGESHGKGILALIDGFPAGLSVEQERIDAELRRRQGGYGRGERQSIESDCVEFLSGICKGTTTGAPITLWVKNRDSSIDEMPEVESPRPGHADLSGAIKYEQPIRPVLERASARETAARVAAGALVRLLLEEFGIRIIAYVVALGPISLRKETSLSAKKRSVEEMLAERDQSVVYSLLPDRDEEVKFMIDEVRTMGDSLGGVVEVQVHGVPVGLGSHAQWDRKLDARIAHSVLSVQGIKGIEFGAGFESAYRSGSQIHDPIGFEPGKGWTRPTNNAGGIEGGISNGEAIIFRAAMKPIPTMLSPLPSVHWESKEPREAVYERSDICAVPAASVVLENATALILTEALLERYGSDSLQQIRRNFGG